MRHFVAREDSYLCEDCLARHPEIDISLPETQVWSEDSDGWLNPIACHDCGLSIPITLTPEAAAWHDWHERANVPAMTVDYQMGQLQLADLHNPNAYLTWSRSQ